MNAPTPQSAARRPQPRELTKILGDCRDLAIHRLLLSFAAMLDRIGDMLMERANRSDVREEAHHFLAARSALLAERVNVMAEFERRLREQVDNRIAGDAAAKPDFSKVDASNLTLIDITAMDESVITGNITRVIENFCHEELQTLNRGMSHLLGRPDLETSTNPLSPSTVIDAFAGALRGVEVEDRIKFTILKELNQSSLGDLNAIYADINRHLVNLKVVPAAGRPSLVNLDYATNRARARAKINAKAAAREAAGGAELDVMALFKKMFGQQPPTGQGFAGTGPGMAGMPGGAPSLGAFPGMGGAGFPGAPGGGAGFPGGQGMGGGGFPGAPGVGGAGFPGAPGMGGAGFHGAPGMGGAGFHGPGTPGGAAPSEADGYNPYWMLGVEPPTPQSVAPGTTVPGAPAMPGGPLDPNASASALGVPGGLQHDPASGPRFVPHGPLPATPSGYVPGAPIMATRELGESLSRLQAGETGFDLGGGTYVRFSGIPQGKHNVLRDLQESPLALRVNQIEAMTIELVAMLFDFIFETRDLPDGIKALLARLQIPVLKAAMLDGAFFAKKSHPSRVLVNALGHAGMGWSPMMGHDDPLYRKIHDIVHRILDDFSDNLTVFEESRHDLERFLAEEERVAETNIQSSTEEINQRDRREIAPVIAGAEIERHVANYEIPNFLATFLRQRWASTLEHVYLDTGEESEAWGQAIATLEDLVWSIQPKRSVEERKQLVAMLPSLLKRLSAGLHAASWPAEEREEFLSHLVEAHAASVKPSLAATRMPTEAVAAQAKADAEQAKAAGDEVAAAKAEQLALAMSPAEPPPPAPEPEIASDDPFLEIAQSLERGMWVEFEGEDGQLTFSKLAWVSPLRGTYLFCNRQGQKASSMTAEELATRFRSDKARLVEAEPLVDRAFTTMMAGFKDKLTEPAR
jgi:hypothetical protein